MKRYFWLWISLAGAILLPLVAMGCLYVVASLFPHPRVPVNIAVVIHYTAFKFALAGAGYGFCTAMLWMGTRHFGWRLLSIIYGLIATACCIFIIWNDFAQPSFPSAKFHILLLDTTILAPAILWGLALFFFALLIRARPKTS